MNERSLHALLERIGGLLRSETRRAAMHQGLQPVQLEALVYLSRCNRYSDTPAALADYLGLTRGTVSQSLLALERKGLLKRIPDREDRRVVHLRLAPEGLSAAATATGPAIWESACSTLHPDLLERMGADLEALLAAMQKAHGARTFGQCHSCRHLLKEGAGTFRCGLTRAPLAVEETRCICREHEPPQASAGSGGTNAS